MPVSHKTRKQHLPTPPARLPQSGGGVDRTIRKHLALMMPGPSQRLKFDVVLLGVLLGIAPGGGVDGEALHDNNYADLRIICESASINFPDAGRDCHIGQIDAAIERLTSDAGYTLQDGDVLELLAAVKGAVADFFDTSRDRYAPQAFTAMKSGHTQPSDILWNGNGPKVFVFGKRPVPDFDDAVWDRYALDAGAVLKGVVSDLL